MRFFSRKKRRSGAYARNRVRILLLSERIQCSPQTMRHMKQDFIHTVKKYARIDEKNVTVWISSDPPVIHAEIPITKNQERA